MKTRKILAATTVVLAMSAATIAFAGGPPAEDAIWADGHLYRTVATPTHLPPKGKFDGLAVIGGLEGQHPVSESKPGDRDYNGGRWQVYAYAFTPEGAAIHDPDGDGAVNFELNNWEAVQAHVGLGHLEFVGMGPRFVCPLIK